MLWYQLADQWGFVGGTWSLIDNLVQDPGGEIFVRLSGTGRFAGHASNVINYSYSEGSTPLVPGDESGAIGDVSIEVLNDNDASILLYKDEFYLNDNFHGSVLGDIESVSGNNDTVTMGGRSKLALLNVDTVIPPRSGTIGNVIEGVINDLGITTNILKDASLSTDIVRVPGYEGDAWVYIKQLCSAYEVEVTVIREYIIIRPARQRIIDATNIIDKSWQVQDIELAQEFDVAYYNYVARSNYLVYPEGGWNSEVQVYQVAANETTEFELDLEFFLTSVQQPTVQDTVAKDYSAASVYAVSGNDNLPVTAAFWTDYGGDMSFEILGDGSRVRVTVTGPSYEPLSPYSISISDGSTSYSTLRIVGTGMDFNRLLYTEKTGLTANDTPTIKGTEIDNPAIDTLEDAKRYALYARRLYSLPTQTYSTSSNTFPRLEGSIPSIFYPTFDDFDDSLPTGYTFANFNSDYSGLTFDEFTVQLGNEQPQGFGEVAGSKVQLDDAMYRVRNVTITPDIVSFDAEYDTLFSDLNPIYGAVTWSDLEAGWSGVGSPWSDIVVLDYPELTFSDFNTTFGEVNFKDYALIPLRRGVVYA
jgi:hypothetical protein